MLPILYHAHHNQEQDDLPFWLGLAEESGGPILELGCGTGRVMIPLIQAGYQVTGLDLDGEMLAYLKVLADSAGLEPPSVFKADLTDFNLGQQFPLIILPCNTYSILNTEQRQAALGCITRHLSPNGVFAVSMPNPDWLREIEDVEEIEVETVFIHPETGNPVQASNEWHRTQNQLEIRWHYDHLLPDGQVERLSASAHHFLNPVQDYITELEAHHFDIKTFGNYDRTPFSAEQPFLIIAAALKPQV